MFKYLLLFPIPVFITLVCFSPLYVLVSLIPYLIFLHLSLSTSLKSFKTSAPLPKDVCFLRWVGEDTLSVVAPVAVSNLNASVIADR
jgi:hypothetical protein